VTRRHKLAIVPALLAALGTAWGLAVVLRASAEEPAHAPGLLRDTGLYAGVEPGAPLTIDPRNRPFVPQYPLWSDGAGKSRWVFLPPGQRIDATDEHQWVLPVGTRFWKEFRVAGRRIETRMIWKASADRWVFASYAWNRDGTEATLAPERGMAALLPGSPDRPYRIPAVTDCRACHGGRQPRPLGFNALQLSSDRDPGAIHGETPGREMVTLDTLLAENAFGPAPAIDRRPRIRAATPDARTALGYLMTNCGSCHDGSGDIATPGLVIRAADLVRDGDAVARSLVDTGTTWQRPGVQPGTSTVLVSSDNPTQSAILLRMRSRRPSSQMPPIGTSMRDDAALTVVERWVAEVVARGGGR
jgi:hypothetical protein